LQLFGAKTGEMKIIEHIHSDIKSELGAAKVVDDDTLQKRVQVYTIPNSQLLMELLNKVYVGLKK
jgi:predicted metalloprotease